MTKKIDAALAKKLNALKITAKTEDEARKKLLAILDKEGIEGMEDEDTDTLIDMVGSFVSDEEVETDEVEEEIDETEEEPEVDDEEKEADELAEEVAEEEAKEETETEEETEDDEPEVEEEPEPEKEEKKSAKKTTSTKKKAKEPAKKTETKKAEPVKAKDEKKKTSKRGKRLDPKNIAADRDEFNVLKKIFGEGYAYSWLASFGVTIKYVGKNGNRAIATVENCTKLDDGNIRCDLYLFTMTKQTDKLDELGLDYGICWSNAPFMKGITLDEAVDILKKLYKDITSFVTTVDKRLGDNRKKMEENLKNSGKKSTKTAAAKKAKK